MSYFGNGKEGEKLLRGAYSYTRNDTVYSEETFEVFRDKKEMTYTFVSEMISRVATGELLNINTRYTVNKDYLPIEVQIKRNLGNQHVEEHYSFNQRTTRITYTFKDKEGEKVVEIPTSPKFYITAPTSCTAMLFIRSKKFDTTAKNYYSIFTSKNMWKYEQEPQVRNIVATRVNPSVENLKINDANLEATQYKLVEQILDQKELDEREKSGVPQEDLRVWTSPYMTVPYLIKSQDGTRVQVNYLNNLDKNH